MGTEPLVLGRFLRGEAAPAPVGLKRWRAVDQATGEPVDLVGPDASVLIRPGALEQFQAAAGLRADHPALLLAEHSGMEDRRPLLVRAPSEPLGTLPRLDADQALALAAWLAPAAIEAQQALGGMLSPDDLVVDELGQVRLSPRGLGAAGALKPPPYQAPEQRDGAPPLPGSALYGLGVMLFQATTGQPYLPGRRARALDPSLPESLDLLLAALCDPDPQRRLQAAQALPEGQPVLLPRPSAMTVEAPSSTLPTPSEPEVAPAEAWHLVLASPPATAAARGRLAALLDLPREVLEPMVERDEAISLDRAASPDRAQARLAQLRELGIEATVVPPASPWAAALLFTTALGAVSGVTLGLVGAVLGLFASFLVLAASLAGLLLGVLLAALSLGLYRKGAQRSSVEGAFTRQARLRRQPATGDDELSRALRRAHRRVLESELHPVVRLDHERMLEELEAQRPLRPAAELIQEAERIARQARSLGEAALGEAALGEEAQSQGTRSGASRRATGVRTLS